jgi:hypothetical protein
VDRGKGIPKEREEDTMIRDERFGKGNILVKVAVLRINLNQDLT